MAIFRNFGVNRRNPLCGEQKYASRNATDFLELAENCTFMDRKSINAINDAMKGYQCFLLRVRLRFRGTDKRFTLMSTGLFWVINVHLAGPRRRQRGVDFSCQQLWPMVGAYYRLYDKGFGLRYRSLAYYTTQPHPSGLAKIFTLKPIASNKPYRHNHDRPSPSARYRRTQNLFFHF